MVARVGWLSARARNLVNLRAVGINLPPIFPEFEVQAISHAPEGMEQSRTPCFS